MYTIKNSIILLLFITICTIAASSQNLNDTLEIYKMVQQTTNELNSYEKMERQNDSFGNSYAYFKNKKLKLVTLLAYDEGLEKNVVWYFNDGELIYADTKWYNPQTKEWFQRERCYLKNGCLLVWFNLLHLSVDSTDESFISIAKELPEYGRKLQERNLKPEH